MIFRIILWSIVLTLVFRFIFRFLLPVVGMASSAQNKLNEMQKQMEDLQKKQQAAARPKKSDKIDGDYIEYEEVK